MELTYVIDGIKIALFDCVNEASGLEAAALAGVVTVPTFLRLCNPSSYAHAGQVEFYGVCP